MRRIQVFFVLAMLSFWILIAGWAYAGDGKAQGQPFQYLQQQIDELKAQIEAIQSSPGQQGPSGPPGSPGTPGTPGLPGLACWDLNGNGICDYTTEDTSLDGKCDVLDCKGQSGSTGAIKVYDSTEPPQYLGVLLGHSGWYPVLQPSGGTAYGKPYAEVFIPSLRGTILINMTSVGPYAIGAAPGEPPEVTVYFADSECGNTNPTPYFDFFAGNIVASRGPNGLRYFLSTEAGYKVIPNYSILRDGTCTPVAHDLGVTFQGIEIQRGDIPFTLPVTLPLVYE
jgi:hypothetical protein